MLYQNTPTSRCTYSPETSFHSLTHSRPCHIRLHVPASACINTFAMPTHLCSVFTAWTLVLLVSLTSGQVDLCDQPDGTETRRGQSWYVCRRGVWYPTACSYYDSQSKTERRVEMGSSFWTPNAVMRCDQTGPGSAGVVQVGCVRQGRLLPIGQTVSDRLFWYLCKMDEGSGLLLQQSGCVDQSGELVQPKGVLVRGSFVYTCIRNETDQSVYLEPRGCSMDGQLYNLGDEVIGHGFWYLCSAKGNATGALELKLMGCYQDGKKLKNGDTFAVGQFAFKCDLSSTNSPVSRISSGCYARSSNGTYEQHPLGDRWLEGTPPVRIVMECKSRGQLSVSKGPVQCYYQSDDRKLQGHLEPECVRLFPNRVMVTCSIKDGKNVDAQIVYRASASQVEAAKKQGFKECR